MMSERTKTATIRHEPGYFSNTCYANIPDSWTIFPDDGSPKIPCDSHADAEEVAEQFGYTILQEDA
jgi:hypothetical protein